MGGSRGVKWREGRRGKERVLKREGEGRERGFFFCFPFTRVINQPLTFFFFSKECF